MDLKALFPLVLLLYKTKYLELGFKNGAICLVVLCNKNRSSIEKKGISLFHVSFKWNR